MIGFSISGRIICKSILACCTPGSRVVFVSVVTLFLLLCIFPAAATIHLSEYTFSAQTGTYQEISGGMVFGNSTTDDQRFVSVSIPLGGISTTGVGIPIGFDFVFSGITYDRLGINANGWIALGHSALNPAVNMTSTDYFHPLSSVPSIDTGNQIARIAGFAQNLQAQTGASLRLLTIGEAPYRICVIQWTNYRMFAGTGQNFNFQIRLHETTNQIRIVYGSYTYQGVEKTVQVGLRGAPASAATNFHTRSSSSGSSNAWQLTDAGSNAAATIRFRSGTRPNDGLTYVFTPPVSAILPSPVTNLSISIAAEGIILQWDEAPGADLYHIYSADNPYDDDWDFETAQSTTTWLVANPNTSRFFRIISVRIDR